MHEKQTFPAFTCTYPKIEIKSSFCAFEIFVHKSYSLNVGEIDTRWRHKMIIFRLHKKISTRVAFPEILDLSPFISHKRNNAKQSGKFQPNFCEINELNG